MASDYPGYLTLFESGESARRARLAVEALADCALCGRQCHADRLHEAETRAQPGNDLAVSEGDCPLPLARIIRPHVVARVRRLG